MLTTRQLHCIENMMLEAQKKTRASKLISIWIKNNTQKKERRQERKNCIRIKGILDILSCFFLFVNTLIVFTVQRRYRVYFSWIHREREKKDERWSWNSEQTTHKKSKRAPMTCVSVCNVHSARTFLSVCLFRFLYIQVLMLYQKATTIKRRNCFFERKKQTHVQFTTFGICISWCSWSNMVFFASSVYLRKLHTQKLYQRREAKKTIQRRDRLK